MKNVLMVIGGRLHPFAACGEIFKQAMEVGGQFKVEVTQERAALANPSSYDAVVMYTVGGEMSRSQEQGLVSYVRGGGGLVAIHCANAEMERFKDYIEMVGTSFVRHGPFAEFSVEIAAGVGDILPRLSPSFKVNDEFYLCERQTEAELREFQHGIWQFDRHPLGYVRDYGRGRVFYTALGHDEQTFRHADFQDQLYKGLRYVCGLGPEGNVRIGLLGYGPAFGMGQHHAESIEATQGFELAAVCDRDPVRLGAAREEQGDHIATFAAAKEMAESGKIDLGIVILPHAFHGWGMQVLLEAGLHVIVEKPFATRVEDCDAAIALAREKGVMLSVYHNRHWDPDILTLRHVVEAGLIGEIYSIECNMVGYGRPGQAWRSHKPISGGSLYDMGAHQFEKIMQLVPRENALGEPLNRSASLFGNFAKKVWHDTTNEDYIRAYVHFAGGVEAQVLVSSICATSKPLWTILGTRGAVVMDDGQSGARVTSVDKTGQHYNVQIANVSKAKWGDYYKNLADHLLAGVSLIITPEWAKAPIQCIEGCERAARENRLIEVTFDF
ncbi:MAG: hypothetical protein CME16_04400 [Gemmatimonadetes bacterium]|nr:hypothetical protein [Gemmatimonadota bacterium]